MIKPDEEKIVYFCENEACENHVSTSDPQVKALTNYPHVLKNGKFVYFCSMCTHSGRLKHKTKEWWDSLTEIGESKIVYKSIYVKEELHTKIEIESARLQISLIDYVKEALEEKIKN